MTNHTICDTPGPCWDGYIYVGPTVGAKGSCIKKEKLCKKTKGKGAECLKHVGCGMENSKSTDVGQPKKIDDYTKCLNEASIRFQNGDIKLCPRGYCTAKHKFEVYPSAYANGYASSVCKGTKPDLSGISKKDSTYSTTKKKNTKLNRWFDEKWVNLCEKGDGPGGFKACGTGKGVDSPENYPYCRAYFKKPGTTVVTVEELKQFFPNEFETIVDGMCEKKRSLPQGMDGKPTRVMLPDHVYAKIKKERMVGAGSIDTDIANIPIPTAVKDQALLGLQMMELGFSGGTQTGWDRGKQLAYNGTIDIKSLADMRTWFARHGPDASGGGTSYPGYCKWVNNGMNLEQGYNQNRGAVSWLIWGGDAAYKWLKETHIRHALQTFFPKRKSSPKQVNLSSTCLMHV